MNVKTTMRLIAGLIVVFVLGCDWLPPTEKEVKEAVEAVFQGFVKSTQGIRPKVANDFQNVLDVKYVADGQVTVHTMRGIVYANQAVDITGTCVYNGYEDKHTHYVIDGDLSYDGRMTGPQSGSLDIHCDVDLTGGKVKTLEFTCVGRPDGTVDDFAAVVNGKDFEFNKLGRLLEHGMSLMPDLN